MDPGVRRPAPPPWKPARDLVADRADAAAQVVLSVGIPVPQIDALDLRRDLAIAERGKNHRENDLAERTRLRELHETPFRVEPIRSEDQHDGMTARDLLIEVA